MDEDVFFKQYAAAISFLVSSLATEPIAKAVDLLHDAWVNGRNVMFCGNGGSGSSCSHIVNDMQKDCRLRASCLNDCIPLVSAYANDISWDSIFEKQIEVMGRSRDVLVCVSGSGNSKNVLRAASHARGIGMYVIALTGFDGGELARNCTVNLHIPIGSMQQAEDCHMVLLHMIYLGLKRRIEIRRTQTAKRGVDPIY